MTIIGAPLGFLAILQVAAASCCALVPADPSLCRGGREAPAPAPDLPAGCHATLSCAEHRKLRSIP